MTEDLGGRGAAVGMAAALLAAAKTPGKTVAKTGRIRVRMETPQERAARLATGIPSGGLTDLERARARALEMLKERASYGRSETAAQASRDLHALYGLRGGAEIAALTTRRLIIQKPRR